MIEVVVFDLDDTLFPEHDYVASGFRAVSEWLRAQGRPPIFDRAWELFSAGVRGDIFNRCLLEQGREVSAEGIRELVSVYRSHSPQIELYEDAAWILNELRGSRLALITDGYLEAQQAKVKALGLAGAFELIVYSDELGRDRWKPHPAPFEKVTRELGVRPGSCVYVGDNLTKDFVGCRELGWHTVFVSRPNGEYTGLEVEQAYRADREVSSLRDLPAVLESLS